MGGESRALLRQTVFRSGEAGTRALLDIAAVASAAKLIGRELVGAEILGADAVANQAIAFDKSASANWLVVWHQDLMFPFARAVDAPGYELSGVKDGIHFARPPREVLEALLAVR